MTPKCLRRYKNRLAADRTQNLEQSKWMYAFKRESSDFEEWINEQLQLAASEEYGQDYEHLQVYDYFVFNILDRSKHKLLIV
jgi:hypothetical protein